MDVDVHTLTNDELRYMLKRYGVEPGPIVGTTRRVYENKLVALLQEGGTPQKIIVDRTPSPVRPTQPTVREPSPVKFSPASPPIFGSTQARTVFRDRDYEENDRMEGEEQFRFVPTNESQQSFGTFTSSLRDSVGGQDNNFSSSDVRFRSSRFTSGDTPTSRLYPDLREDEAKSSWTKPLTSTMDFGYGGSSSSSSVFSQPHRPTSFAPRTAVPRDVYGNNSHAAGGGGVGLIPIWLKIVLSLLVTIFVIMLFRRYAEESGSSNDMEKPEPTAE